MKPYLLQLVKADINILERAVAKNKYSGCAKRLADAKKVYQELQTSHIVKKKFPDKDRVVKKMAKHELIKQYLKEGEKREWIVAECKTTHETIRKLAKEINNETPSTH